MFNRFLDDWFIFPLLQILLVLIFLNGLRLEWGWFTKKSNLTAEVIRGEKSWAYFQLFFGISSLVMLEIIAATEALVGYKTIITAFDLVILFYLCFYNNWFRNKIVGLFGKSESKHETHI